MDLLRTAVVDITTLVATCHALAFMPPEDETALQPKLRRRLRRELKRATVAYIDALSRTRRGTVDDALLRTCRVAAEAQMPHALAHQAWLGSVLASEAGSLDGLAAARQDLWRLALVAIHLGGGMAALRSSSGWVDAKPVDALATRLRRRLRKALITYARATLRTSSPQGRLVVKAREAALAEIGPRGAAEAGRLATIEADCDPSLSIIRQGVNKPLHDLSLDWQHREPGSS